MNLSTKYWVVIDTNVFTSAYLWGGLPAKVIDLWLNKEISLVTSPHLISEIALVFERFNYQKEKVARLKSTFIRQSHILSPEKVINICRDEKDNFIFLTCPN